MTDQPLWIYDAECNTASIELGVAAAKASLAAAGVTAAQALAADRARANGDDYDPAHLDAWDYAERAALIASGAGERAMLNAA